MTVAAAHRGPSKPKLARRRTTLHSTRCGLRLRALGPITSTSGLTGAGGGPKELGAVESENNASIPSDR
eukprot:8769025-Pyramimonas_sp.AAC.1